MPPLPSHDGSGPSESGQPSDSLTPEAQVMFMKCITNDALSAPTSAQKGCISSIRFLETTPELTGIQLKRTIADMFPPASLFQQEICDLPAVHIELRNFLDSRGGNLEQHSSHRGVVTLAHGLYEEPEDTQAAIDMAREIVAAGCRSRSNAPGSSRRGLSQPISQSTNVTSPNHTSSEKVAHNVAVRLKDKEKKFSGDLGESWMEYVNDYLQLCRDYSLSPTQKLHYLHNLLRGDAKRYYLDKVDGYATSFQQATQMLESEYNFAVHQTRVKTT